ncbi:hypothetical protein [Asaia platycodi]|uniref:hypothetical protein n=1 Tax=Asaia platycodi TaxID=610243 RepID=UPI000AEB2CA4|nr:hypothetical protein [Asaia platycodi]
MSGSFDPKELKVLSDILALVLEEQEGQSVAALSALRSRAKKSGMTGGALKNLFVAIAPNPPARAKPRATRTTKTTENSADTLAARQQIVTLTNNLRQMDLELRNSARDLNPSGQNCSRPSNPAPNFSRSYSAKRRANRFPAFSSGAGSLRVS